MFTFGFTNQRKTGISHQPMKLTECAKASLLVVAIWGRYLDLQSLQNQNKLKAREAGKTNWVIRQKNCIKASKSGSVTLGENVLFPLASRFPCLYM